MKVLHVITGLAAGGAETQLELLLRYTRHTPEVATLYNFGSVGRQMAAKGVRVYDLGMRSNRQVSTVFRLAGLMRRGGYDAVHVHLYRACIYGRIAARLAGVPVVVTSEHSLGTTHIEGRRKSVPVRLLYLATEPFSDATIAVSPVVKERLIDWGVPNRKVRVIPNGLDFEHFAFDARGRTSVRETFGIPPDGYVMGSIGRLHPNKGFDALIRAAGPLLKDGGWLLLVGGGSERSRLQRLARDLGLDRNVVFAGEREDVPRLLSAMDTFVSFSKEGTETYGIAVLEALAAGRRAVVFECPALDGFGVDGVRWIPRDVVRLRHALAEERSVRSRPARLTEDLKERYDIRFVADAIDGLYESLLLARHGRSAR